MSKSYSNASEDVYKRIERLRDKHHKELENVTIGALFVFVDGTEQCLTHGGYPAAAVARITPLRDRAAGLPDAMIVVDRFVYSSLTGPQCEALLDHELYHFERVMSKQTGKPKVDAVNRPKLQIRKHDRQFGWFDEIALRHGQHSVEVMQAKAVLDQTGQLYFDFSLKQENAA